MTLQGCALGFQNFHHFVVCGVGCVLLEVAGNGENCVAHADLGHAVGAAGGAGLADPFCHTVSLQFVKIYCGKSELQNANLIQIVQATKCRLKIRGSFCAFAKMSLMEKRGDAVYLHVGDILSFTLGRLRGLYIWFGLPQNAVDLLLNDIIAHVRFSVGWALHEAPGRCSV